MSFLLHLFGASMSLEPYSGKTLIKQLINVSYLMNQVISKSCMLTNLTITPWHRHPHHLHLQTRDFKLTWPAHSHTPPVEWVRDPTPSCLTPLLYCLPWGSVPLMLGLEHHLCSKEALTWSLLSASTALPHQQQRGKGERIVSECRNRADGLALWFFPWGICCFASCCYHHTQPHRRPGAS